MANGFSAAAVAGKREIMELGSTEFSGERKGIFALNNTRSRDVWARGFLLKQ